MFLKFSEMQYKVEVILPATRKFEQHPLTNWFELGLQAVPLASENDIIQTQILMSTLIGEQYRIVNEMPCCLSDSSEPAVCVCVCVSV